MSRLAYASLLLAAACTHDDELDPVEPIEETICAEQMTDASGLVICRRAFAELPRVHLPADVIGASGTEAVIYAGATPGRLHLRDGRELAMRDADGEIEFPLGIDPTFSASRVPAGFRWPSYEFARTIYRVRGTLKLPGPEERFRAAIVDPIVEPVARLTPEVLDGAMTGAWEGTMSRRTGDHTYDAMQRVPIRVTWTGYAPERTALPTWIPYDASDVKLDDILTARGTIANATQALTLADGRCAPSLASLGAASPIFEADADVEMLRVVAMHVPGDYQLSFEGGMGSMMPAHPAAFIQTQVNDGLMTTFNFPHGAPTGMQLLEFRAVTGGGAPCTP